MPSLLHFQKNTQCLVLVFWILVTDILRREGLWMICQLWSCELPQPLRFIETPANNLPPPTPTLLRSSHRSPPILTQDDLDARSCDWRMKDPRHLLPYSEQNRPSKQKSYILLIIVFQEEKPKSSGHDDYSKGQMTTKTKWLTWLLQLPWVSFLVKIQPLGQPPPDEDVFFQSDTSPSSSCSMAAFAEESLAWRTRGFPDFEGSNGNREHSFAECGVGLGESSNPSQAESALEPASFSSSAPWTSQILCSLTGIWFLCDEFASLSARQVGNSSLGERKLHACDWVLCVAEGLFSTDLLVLCDPCPQPPKKKNVCAESLFYGTRVCGKHTCVIS